jgi:hypothetical protein
MAKASEGLRERRDFCEAAFSFLIRDFGYRRSLRRFRYGGFQVGYLGPGAGVLVEWMPRDPVTARLLPVSPGEVPANWGGPGGPGGYDLGFLVLLAGEKAQDMYSLTDDVITELARQLRASGQGMLRGDYSLVPAVRELMALGTSPGPEESPSRQALAHLEQVDHFHHVAREHAHEIQDQPTKPTSHDRQPYAVTQTSQHIRPDSLRDSRRPRRVISSRSRVRRCPNPTEGAPPGRCCG